MIIPGSSPRIGSRQHTWPGSDRTPSIHQACRPERDGSLGRGAPLRLPDAAVHWQARAPWPVAADPLRREPQAAAVNAPGGPR